MTSNPATEKQIDVLISLYNRINNDDARFASQVPQPKKAKLTVAEASMRIDDLRERLANPRHDLNAGVDGAPTAKQALEMLGALVTLTTTSDRTGRLSAIVPSAVFNDQMVSCGVGAMRGIDVMTELTVPEWLVPGAPVVLYTTGGADVAARVREDTIKLVGKMWFTVTDPREPRFRIDGCRASLGEWHTRRVVPLDSDTAREKITVAQRHRLMSEARAAFDTWRRDPTDENREAAIEVLQAIPWRKETSDG